MGNANRHGDKKRLCDVSGSTQQVRMGGTEDRLGELTQIKV